VSADAADRCEDPRALERSPLFARLCRLYELPDERQRSAAIEGVRGFAVALVFGVHFHALFSDYLNPASLSYALSALAWNIGHAGVDVFFALSGALIYEVVLRRRQTYGGFMRRRVQRIFPCFLAVYAVYVALSFLIPSESKLPDGAFDAFVYLLANAALLPGVFPIQPMISVAWSLSYEFLFYALLPLVVYGLAFGTRSRRTRVLWLLGITGALSAMFLVWPMSIMRMLMFPAGMLALEARNSEWFRSRLTRAGEIAVWGLLIVSFPAIVYFSASPKGPIIWTHGALAVLFVTYFWVVVYVTAFEGRFRRTFSVFGLRWLGNISYSFYLLHGLTLKALSVAVHAVLPPGAYGTTIFWSMVFIGFPAAFVASTVLFVMVEKPLSLRKRPAPVVRGGVV
jgi:peptidoglycan/LPS O-acetylase OafA/YrhL